MTQIECSRCGCSILSGVTRYIVSVSLVADFDGIVPEGTGGGSLEALMKEIDQMSQEDLENEIYQQFTFIICKPCRDEYIKNPSNRNEGLEQMMLSPH